MSNPWFKFYAADFLTDRKIAELSDAEIGVLVKLWCLVCRQNEISLDTKLIAKQIQTDYRTFAKMWTKLQHFFIKTDTGYYSERLRNEAERNEHNSNYHKENGRKGGLQKAVNLSGKTLASDPSKTLASTSSKNLPCARTESESESDTDTDKESTPLTPPLRGGGRSARRATRKSPEAILPFTPETEKVLDVLWHKWPRGDPDGRKIQKNSAEFGARVMQILNKHSDITPEMLIQAGVDYISSKRKRYKAPQYFFGPGNGEDVMPWLAYVQMLKTYPKPSQEENIVRLSNGV